MSNPTIGFIDTATWHRPLPKDLPRQVQSTVLTSGAAHYDKLEKTTAKVGANRCAPLPKSQTRPTLSSSPSNRTRSPARSLTKAHSSYPLRQAGILAKYCELFGASDAHPVHHSEHADGRRQRRARHGNRQHADRRTNRRCFERLFADQLPSNASIPRIWAFPACIAGRAPAFTDMYIEALGDAGVSMVW